MPLFRISQNAKICPSSVRQDHYCTHSKYTAITVSSLAFLASTWIYSKLTIGKEKLKGTGMHATGCL